MQGRKDLHLMLDLNIITSLGSFQDLLIFRVSRSLPRAHNFLPVLQSLSVQRTVFSQPGLSVQLGNGFSF